MSLSLLDWRRRIFALYAEVRAMPDRHAAHDRWRDVRNELFGTHPESPLPAAARPGFTGLSVAPYDPDLRFEVPVETGVPPETFEFESGRFDRIGVVDLPGLGSLDVWELATYGGGIFVPVKDPLSGAQTYGGGRYVIDTVKGADLGGTDGMLVLDLNFAYNPSCAYDPRWACPLAPPGNVLSRPAFAGELFVGG